jgi:hypothetical protein
MTGSKTLNTHDLTRDQGRDRIQHRVDAELRELPTQWAIRVITQRSH